jgi:isoaspartyl peptidase/L-asparaginase-like protein (Ntn-hydrolase superfamily)
VPDTSIDRVTLGRPALAIHGGAGRRQGHIPFEDEVAGLHRSLEAGWAVLAAGGSALDAAVAAVTSMEDSGVFNAGRGGVPTRAGVVETDAGVMGLVPDGDGWRRVSGAACAMTWPANPVLVARAIAETGEALLLAGPGADHFAADSGLARRDEADLTYGGGAPVSSMGTVGAVAIDDHGHLGAATSTGGRTGQPPGRVGDSPIIGAGTWADEGGVAVSATGDGEAFVRAGFAHRVDAAIRAGTDLDRAAMAALVEVERWEGTGGAIVLAATGDLVVVWDTPAIARGWRGAAGTVAGIIDTES